MPTKQTEITERWLPVAGYKGLYDVSDAGFVRSLPRQTKTGVLGGKILTPCASAKGYLRVTLSREGEQRRFLVHRLVLSAFAGISDLETRHLNGVRFDNRLENLAWGTRSENARDRVIHGTQFDNRGENHGNTKLSNADALEIRALAHGGKRHTEIAKLFATSPQTIGRIANGKGWSCLEDAA